MTSTFSRSTIESRADRISRIDSDEETGLDLFCYDHCSNDDDYLVKQCRGLVFHGDELVARSFPYASEHTHLQKEKLSEIFTDFSDWNFFDAYEGTILRMFYFSGQWFLSTHRKLNAFRSKWASKNSFGDLFTRALEREALVNEDLAFRLENYNDFETPTDILTCFQNTLDRDRQYMFLLLSTEENRIVATPPPDSGPFILHVGTYVGDKLVMNEDLGLFYSDQREFSTVSDLVKYVESVDSAKLQGLVAFGPNNTQVKVYNHTYFSKFQIRGNEPSIKFRYLQIRNDSSMTRELYALYPEMESTFVEMEEILAKVARYIHKSYLDRFVRKQHVVIPREEYQVVKECHSWHIANRETNKVTLERVRRVMDTQSPSNLNHMIRHFRMQQQQLNTAPESLLNPGRRLGA